MFTAFLSVIPHTGLQNAAVQGLHNAALYSHSTCCSMPVCSGYADSVRASFRGIHVYVQKAGSLCQVRLVGKELVSSTFSRGEFLSSTFAREGCVG